MTGPFTTISVDEYFRMQDVIRAASTCELGHGANCLAAAGKPCTCGLDDLDVAISKLEALRDGA